MSKEKTRKMREASAPIELGLSASDQRTGMTEDPITESESKGSKGFGLSQKMSYLKNHWLTVGVIALVSIGAMGAGLKYLEQDANRVKIERSKATPLNPADDGLLAKVNPFLTAPTPTPTPQLSKEYLYAGSRLLAVEEANANAAPPADLAVWRPSNGVFYVLGGAGSQQTFFQWGISTDRPSPGDYDGDGKTDFAIFRPSSGEWWVFRSSNSTSFAVQFGASCPTPAETCDKIAQADYDGDGKTDAAVFRPTNFTWYILPSSGGSFYGAPFGYSTDVPAPADYDGDGKADIGVWRDSGKIFYSNNSGNSALSTAIFNDNSSQPVSGDYDGDGKADYAIRSGNNWIIRNSSNNQTTTIAWQTGAETAVQNDYDGDGKVDIATWNNTTGNWFIRQSASNNSLRQVAWGITGDIPVPAFYRRN